MSWILDEVRDNDLSDAEADAADGFLLIVFYENPEGGELAPITLFRPIPFPPVLPKPAQGPQGRWRPIPPGRGQDDSEEEQLPDDKRLVRVRDAMRCVLRQSTWWERVGNFLFGEPKHFKQERQRIIDCIRGKAMPQSDGKTYVRVVKNPRGRPKKGSGPRGQPRWIHT